MVQTTNHYLGTTADGYNVYDRADSHFHSENGITKDLLQKALQQMYANGVSFKKEEIHFAKSIGLTSCVSTTAKDHIVMVYRKGRQGKTPMVKGRKPEPCNILTVIIRKEREEKYKNHYTLITCFVGGDAKREPWDKGICSDEERRECEEYWNTHALIYNPDLIDWNRM